MVRNSGKRIRSLFVGILLRSMSAFSQNSCLSGLDLVILWPKVMNNYGVPEIRVFLGWILAILWPKVMNNYGVPKIRVFLGWILVILWPKVTN